MRERHWSNNYQHLFINWEAKEIDHSIFIKSCKDFANAPPDTGMAEKYVDHVIEQRRCVSVKQSAHRCLVVHEPLKVNLNHFTHLFHLFLEYRIH